METLKSFFRIFGINTLVVTVMAIAATYICRKYGFTENFPMNLIGLAVVFPIVFSINGAYKRRESVLDQYANLKGHGRAIFFASRDWIPDEDPKAEEKLKQIIRNVMSSSKDLFISHGKDSEKEQEAYANLSALSKHIQEFRGRGLASGEVSRANSYLSKMMVAFEKLKHISQYRTPRTLRAYSKVFIYILPVLYGPYFASIADGKEDWMAYILPCLLSVILVSLDNIQEHLEHPFDGVGEDDVNIKPDKFITKLDA